MKIPASDSNVPFSLILETVLGTETADGNRAASSSARIGEDAPDYEHDRTFGSAPAPWVGSERVWRERMVPLPHEEPVQYGTLDSGGVADESLSMALSEAELATVISTMPPPHRADGRGSGSSKRLKAVVELFGLAGAAAIVAVVLFNGVGARPSRKPVEKSARASGFLAAPSASHRMVDTRESVQGRCDSSASWTDAPAMCEPSTRQDQAITAGRPGVSHTADGTTNAKRVDGHGLASTTPKTRVQAAAAVTRSGMPSVSIYDLAASTPLGPSADATSAKAAETKSGERLDPESPPAAEVVALEDPANTPANAPISPLEAILMAAKTSPPATGTNGSDPDRRVEPETTRRETKTLSDADIDMAMAGISLQVKRCSGGKDGSVLMKMVVSGSTGRVIAANPADNAYIGTSTGVCVSRAAGLAKFPKFDLESQHIEHRFDLR